MDALLRLDRKLCEWSDRGQDLAEEIRVKWFMLDAQQKQAIMLVGISIAYTLVDIVGAVAKTRIEGRKA